MKAPDARRPAHDTSDAPPARSGHATSATALRMAWALCLAACVPGAALAQVHPGGRWLTLETAHFRVHVRAEIEALGVEAAADAETAYAALAARLPAPGRRIEVIIGDNADYTNGFATEYPVPTAFVLAAPPTGDVELGNYDTWLHVGLAHELTHVFELDLARGWWHLARGVFGRMPGLFPNLYAPDWLIEGLAVDYESGVTGRGRADGTFHRAIVGAQDAEVGAMPIDAAIGTGPRWPDGYRPYAFGSQFLEWATSEYGDSTVPRLVRETARRPIPYLWLSGALRPVAGLSLSQAWATWQDSLVAAAARDAGRAGEGGGGAVLLRGLREAVPPRVSPDGREILFADDRGRDTPRLATLQRGSGRLRGLARLNGAPALAYDAAGDVVLSQLDFTDPYTELSDLWEVSAAGSEQRRTWGARLRDPDVAPDGAIVATRLGGGRSELVMSDSEIRPLTPSEPGVEWAQPRFSPDGRTIVAIRQRDGWPQVVLLDRSGRLLRQVTDDSALSRTPAFSPDGAWLFWSSDRSGSAQVYATRAGESAGRRWLVTREPFGAYAPAPASDSVFYLAYHHDGFSLAAVAFDTTEWRAVPGETPGRTAGRTAHAPPAAPAPGAASAPPGPVVAAEHPYSVFPSLLPQYWLPVGQSGNGAGSIGVLTSGQDVLGRHVYGATVSVGTGIAAGTWAASVGYVYTRLVPWLVEASYSRSQLLVYTAALAPLACCRTEETANLSLVWWHLRWRTQLATSAGAEYERTGAVRRSGPVASFSAAHVTQPDFAISPQNGWTFAATARERWRTDTALEYHEARLGVTAYRALPLGGFAHAVLAVRGSAGILGGTERVVYGVGGIPESSVELAPGLVLGGSVRTFPVRGYGADALLGRSAAAASVELRLPLALVGRGLGLLPVYLDRMSLSLFADAGAAWFPKGFTTQLPSSSTIGGVGAELVTDLGAVYATPLRLRAGVARAPHAGAPLVLYVAFGPSF